MKLAVVCALGRDFASNLVSNIKQQTFRNFGLIVVENGEGEGSCQRAGLKPNVLARCKKLGPGAVKNIGRRIARDQGATHWAIFDDDDWYGPKYLSELAAAFESGKEIVGKGAYFTCLSSNNVVLFSGGDGELNSNREAQIIQGPTISAAFWEGQHDFDETVAWGEDTIWCSRAIESGHKIWASSPWHFCYMRRGYQHGHTYPARDRHLLGLSRGDLFEVGAWGGSTKRLICSENSQYLSAVATYLPRPELEFDDIPRVELGPFREATEPPPPAPTLFAPWGA